MANISEAQQGLLNNSSQLYNRWLRMQFTSTVILRYYRENVDQLRLMRYQPLS